MSTFSKPLWHDDPNGSRSLDQVQELLDRQIRITDQAAEQTSVELSMSRHRKALP